MPQRANIAEFDKLRAECEQHHGPLPTYRKKQLEMARSYLKDGAPYGINEELLTMTHGRNNFTDAEDQALCIDAVSNTNHQTTQHAYKNLLTAGSFRSRWLPGRPPPPRVCRSTQTCRSLHPGTGILTKTTVHIRPVPAKIGRFLQ